ncbi:acyltransferase family protein [Myceligenerans xiligouense]|uniref:Peptidoglycan/LPS O-acetylase OafA/YrhL n=1 Tax=Myceligenerans xiligouense TaxID=253184 RepID=A0A3N4ZKX7_9MICO|nr:acyltransferase [Myceligenerans xiligouense]RPF21615.1 peptidoglycan/LPS O-acetylase OafA/YrhL [Myceligenerans xiligouense]
MMNTTGTQPGRSPSRLPSLTGLRFFAALLVFGFHITLSASPIPPNDPINPFADPQLAAASEKIFVTTGYIGVSFFFVLSGFLLAWAAKPNDGLIPFWRRRIVKIFPNHLVMWVLAMVLFAAAITPAHAWALNFFLLSAYSPDGAVNVAVNPPSWTLSVELLFYMLFPFLIAGIRRIPVRALWLWAGLMLLGMVLVQVATLTIVPDEPRSALTPVSSYQFWFGYIFPPSRLFEFVLGSIMARIVLEGRWPAVRVWHALVACVAGYAVANVVPFVWTFNVATIIPIAMLVTTVAAADNAGERTFLQSRPMQWLGDTSFGFYLCQGITIFWARQMMDNATYPTPVALLVVAGIFVLTLGGGWALYALVEKPMMDRFARPRRRAALRPGDRPRQLV